MSEYFVKCFILFSHTSAQKWPVILHAIPQDLTDQHTSLIETVVFDDPYQAIEEILAADLSLAEREWKNCKYKDLPPGLYVIEARAWSTYYSTQEGEDWDCGIEPISEPREVTQADYELFYKSPQIKGVQDKESLTVSMVGEINIYFLL